MAGLAPAEAWARASPPPGSPSHMGPALRLRVMSLLTRTELTVGTSGGGRGRAQGPSPAPSSRPAKLGPVGRQPPACAGRAQNVVSAGF